VLPVEAQQAFTGRRVRQRDLDRDVDPPWPRRQRRFQQVGPVGREQEQQVRVGGRAIHGVEQVKQHRA
jgi:hypothetical protein